MAEPIEPEPCIVCHAPGLVEHSTPKLGVWWSCAKDSRASFELRQIEAEMEGEEPTGI